MHRLVPFETDPGRTAVPAPAWRMGHAAAVPGELLIGLVVVALLPALFWVGIISVVASLLEYSVPPILLVIIAVAIAAFLANIFVILLQSGEAGRGLAGDAQHDFARSMPAYAPQVQRISRQTF